MIVEVCVQAVCIVRLSLPMIMLVLEFDEFVCCTFLEHFCDAMTASVVIVYIATVSEMSCVIPACL